MAISGRNNYNVPLKALQNDEKMAQEVIQLIQFNRTGFRVCLFLRAQFLALLQKKVLEGLVY
jgi:hypothetical protein